jgi:hypothetical protein
MPDPTQTQPGPIKTALSSYFKTLIDNVSGPPPNNGEPDLTNFSTPQQAVSDNAKINDLATIAIQHPALANVPKEHKNGFKQFLIALAQGGGDAGLTYAGLPTDYEKSQNAIKNRAISAQADESEASAALKGQQLQGMKTSVPVTMANGTTIMLPQALALKILNTQETNAGKTDVADINAGAKKDVANINQGIRVPLPDSVAKAAGIPELAGQQVGIKTLNALNSGLGKESQSHPANRSKRASQAVCAQHRYRVKTLEDLGTPGQGWN